MIINKIHNYSITAMYLFAIITLIGADITGLFMLLIPDKPIGNLFYITILPLLIGFPGLVLSLVVFGITENK